MKVYYLFSILLVVLGTTFATSTVNKRDEKVNSKSKRDETSDECKYINSWLGEDESYNCCEYYFFDGVYCENGHITSM